MFNWENPPEESAWDKRMQKEYDEYLDNLSMYDDDEMPLAFEDFEEMRIEEIAEAKAEIMEGEAC